MRIFTKSVTYGFQTIADSIITLELTWTATRSLSRNATCVTVSHHRIRFYTQLTYLQMGNPKACLRRVSSKLKQWPKTGSPYRIISINRVKFECKRSTRTL